MISVRQFRNLALLGLCDEDIAFVAGISLLELAILAYNNEEVFNAITPSEIDILNFKNRIKNNEKREKRLAYKRKWQRDKRNSSPSFKIENAVRARMFAALKGKVKKNSIRDLPYTVTELIVHLEGLFSDGMSMSNYGEWHIDHIKPCSMFDHTDRVQFLECWSLSNLQPLWRLDNMSKGDKYERT